MTSPIDSRLKIHSFSSPFQVELLEIDFPEELLINYRIIPYENWLKIDLINAFAEECTNGLPIVFISALRTPQNVLKLSERKASDGRKVFFVCFQADPITCRVDFNDPLNRQHFITLKETIY